MKRLITVILFSIVIVLGAIAQERPRLVVGLVVDQMRWDYLYHYYNEYGDGGLRRLMREGYQLSNCAINYAPTVTAVGHTSIFTGSIPAIHGIAGNYFCNHDTAVYCCDDYTVDGVGTSSKAGHHSPEMMDVETIGDALKIATDWQSRVIGIALKDRAAILPAGHSADAAYWWDDKVGHFVSSTFYMRQLPEWVKEFNKQHNTAPGFNIKTNVDGVTMTFDMAAAAIKGERLGQREGHTDMLTVSISSTDAIGHVFSTRGQENHDVYMRLDHDLSLFLNMLDNTVGRGQYLLFLTADHGAAHNYNQLKAHHIPAGAWDYDKATRSLNAHLRKTFPQMKANPVMFEDNYQFYFDDEVIASAGLEKQRVIDEAIGYLRRDDQIRYAVDNEKLATASMPQAIKERLINGYYRGRSGEITVVTRPQFFGADDSPEYKGTSHGQPYAYDTHIPLIFFGWHVAKGETQQQCYITDIAPTVCSLLRIQAPDGNIGRVVYQ